MRQIALDTETTGLSAHQGHRIIEIGAVEIINRRLTGNAYHQYIRPDCRIDQEAIQVHGITDEFLFDKPRFYEVAPDFMAFVRGAELLIHNASFDTSFLDAELHRIFPGTRISQYCKVTDTLAIARRKSPGQKASLDVLCKRYGVNNGERLYHGALMDADLLAKVYLAMTGGQGELLPDLDGDLGERGMAPIPYKSTPVIRASAEEEAAHVAFLDHIRKKSGKCVWERVAA